MQEASEPGGSKRRAAAAPGPDAASSAAGAAKKPRKSAQAIDFIIENATPIASISFDALSKLRKADPEIPSSAAEDSAQLPAMLNTKGDPIQSAEPYVITGVSLKFMDDAQSPVARSLKAFVEDFKESDVRKKSGRAMRPNIWEQCLAGARDFTLNTLSPLCPTHTILSPALESKHESLRQAMVLSDFGLKGFTRHSSLEKHQLWTGRLIITGSRQVALARAADVANHMRDMGIFGLDVKEYMRELGIDGIKKLLEKTKIYWATTGPGDFVWSPSHFVTMETVAKTDVLGLRVGMLCPVDTTGYTAFKAKSDEATTPASHESKLIVGAVQKLAASVES